MDQNLLPSLTGRLRLPFAIPFILKSIYPFIHLSSSMKVPKFSKSACSYHIYLTKVAGIILLPMQMVSLLHVYRRNQPSSGCRTVCRSDVTCVCRVSSSAAAAVLRERMPRMPSEPPLHRSEVVYPTMGRAPRPPAIVRRKEKARSVRIETGERRARRPLRRLKPKEGGAAAVVPVLAILEPLLS